MCRAPLAPLPPSRAPLALGLALLLGGCLVPGTQRVGGVADASLVRPGAPTTTDPNHIGACFERRERLAATLGSGLFLCASGPEVDGRFEADPDFHWLTGLNEPDAFLLLVFEQGRLSEQRLYLQPASERRALWEGARLAPGTAAARRSGIASVLPVEELAVDLGLLLTGGTSAYAQSEASRTPLADFDVELESPRAALSRLQAHKDPTELAALQTAIDITLASLADAFVIARPGAWEYQVEAAIEGGFRRRGAEFRAFPSICASGPNACVLHYRANRRRMQAGELLLMDVGARYAGYCADVTRTIPIDGRFTPRQRELYELVLATQTLCAGALRPGRTLADVQRLARQNLTDAGYGEAYLHGIGHHLGIRTHDAPGFRGPLEPGMVVTVEPGIYLPEEALGIRIEDDYLITQDGARKLSAALPSDPDRLEAYLRRLRR